MKHILALVLLALALAPMAHAGDYAPPAEGAKNPPSSEPLQNFRHFEHRAVVIAPEFKKKDSGSAQSAREHLQANMALRSIERTKLWNERAGADEGRTLVIEPIIDHVRFVTPGKRVMLGILWGGSRAHIRLRLTDAATGQVIGEPRFYQHASAGAAGWAFGAVDRALLIRLANMVDAYLRDNYAGPAETLVDTMQGDTPEQTAEKAALEQRAIAAGASG